MVRRHDLYVDSDTAGIRLFVREVSPERAEQGMVPLILLHGARTPAVPSFDLGIPGGSLAQDLARVGHRVFAMDGRGYGGSTRPGEMDGEPVGKPSVARSGEVVRDVASVVSFVRERTGAGSVGLVGWATGGHWAGYYAALHPEMVSHLVIWNSLYGGTDGHQVLGRGSANEDPHRPGRFNADAFGAYRLNTGASLLPSWDSSIPTEDKAHWRDPVVVEAYVQAALASDETSSTRDPASFRSPSGAMEDSFYLAIGHQLWDAALITGKVLIVRSGRDFWSRPEDVQRLRMDCVSASGVRVVELPEATHYVHLDRPESGREDFVRELIAFLAPDHRR